MEGTIDLTFSAASTVFDYLAADEQVELVFTVTLDDGNGGIVTQPVTVTIVGTNDAPIVSDIAASTSEDDSVLIEPAYIDPDASDTATITFDASGTTGDVSLVDGKFQYDPNGQFEHLAAGETAIDTFTYTVSDGTAEPVTKTVTVTINGVDDHVAVDASKLWASDGAENDLFGRASAVNDHGVVLVGAGGSDGGAYLYRPKDGGGYDQLKLPDTAGNTDGTSVALNNSGVAVVGSTSAIYVYHPDGQGGYLESMLRSSDYVNGDHFGTAVSINEDGVIAVGAFADDDGGDGSGSVYVFTPDGYGGYDEVKLTASDAAANDNFGHSVTVGDNGHVVVGALLDDGNNGNNFGSVYVYAPDGNGGYDEVKLTASDGSENDQFGNATAVNASGTVVEGARYSDANNVGESGAVYVYKPSEGGTYQEIKLVALDRFSSDFFGQDVAINDDGIIVVGAYGNDDDGSGSGAAYVFVPTGSGGYTEYKLTAPDASEGDDFGFTVAINADGVVTVSARKGDGKVDDSGAVYTFTLDEDGNYVGYDGTAIEPTGPANETITGTFGADSLNGGAGDDMLTGGASSDVFIFSGSEFGNDTITDFEAGAGSDDIIRFDSETFADFDAVIAAASDEGSNVVISLDDDNSVTLNNVSKSELHADDFQFV
ncbi:VCBS domain-containing protein [Pseudovibrio ascidiaceicola]|uniref:VCBS domain-containing protein n=1 Tax=Pseudovibrio ascidiaceicola TaxID=285279 RepID=UPI003D36BA72